MRPCSLRPRAAPGHFSTRPPNRAMLRPVVAPRPTARPAQGHRGPAREPWTRALALVAVLAVGPSLGCGRDADPRDPADHAGDDTHRVDWSARLASADVTTVLAALGQPHDATAATLGPHTLSYGMTVDVRPDGALDPERDLPPVGTRVGRRHTVRDELILKWAAPDRFHLEQHNDHGHGREVIRVDETLYTRLKPRGWTRGVVETDIDRRWLDEANWAVRDAVELAAPQLQVNVTAGSPADDDRPTVRVELSHAASRDPLRIPTGHGQDWRADSEIDAVTGHIVLDAETGGWREVEIEVDYTWPSETGGRIHGTLSLNGQIATGPATISEPPAARPVRERIRYEAERRRILDGLAAP